MNSTKQIAEKFFGEYAARMNRALGNPPEVDVEATAAAFAECFVEASPVGITCGKNGEEFREQIPKGLEFYRSIGTQSMSIDSLEVTALDDYHAMAKVHWNALYQKKDGNRESIEFDVIYFVQIMEKTPRIFCYITGDEQKVMRERGLLS